MDKKVLHIISFVLGSLAAAVVLMFVFDVKPMNDCHDLNHKVCKNRKKGYCESVYVARESIFRECKSHNAAILEETCGDAEATLFDNYKQCIAPKASASCPESVKAITADQVETLYRCPELQADICKQACGARYDLVDVRNFYQTGRKPGILCQDNSGEAVKNGVSLQEDENRKHCLEIYRGVFKWCNTYNKRINDVELGPFVQCQGMLE